MTDAHVWILRELVDRLIERNPLPWHIEIDWTVEVTAKNGNIVMKCMNGEHANALIALAEEVVQERKRGEALVRRALKKGATP